jgi:hypothetical protein
MGGRVGIPNSSSLIRSERRAKSVGGVAVGDDAGVINFDIDGTYLTQYLPNEESVPGSRA